MIPSVNLWLVPLTISSGATHKRWRRNIELYRALFCRLYQGHFEMCTHDAGKTCPLDYETHVRYACPRRCIVCEFCGREFSSDAIEVRANYFLSRFWALHW